MKATSETVFEFTFTKKERKILAEVADIISCRSRFTTGVRFAGIDSKIRATKNELEDFLNEWNAIQKEMNKDDLDLFNNLDQLIIQETIGRRR